MIFKDIFSQLNIISQCRKYGLSLWQCPQFLFLILGLIIMGSTVSSYLIGTRLVDDPQIVALIVIVITSVLFVISIIIVQSFENLAEASRLKSEFVSIVSHQLRSPLSNLKWVTEILMSGKVAEVDAKQLEYFKILKENNSRMLSLVSDLLTVSRIEQGKFPMEKQKISLPNLIDQIIKGVEIFAKASNTEIIMKAPEGLPNVSADPSRLSMVIENLLDNAIRYIQPVKDGLSGQERKTTGRVEIKVENKKNNVYFEIKDNGVGIPKNDHKYVFQKFFRSENIMRHQTAGSGLGLYIAKSIIEKSGGKLGFKSQEGVGSTFWFTLPIKN